MSDEREPPVCPVGAGREISAQSALRSAAVCQGESMVPQGPTVRAAQRVLVEQRAAGWLSLALAHGKTFRYGGALATCDAELTHQLLMERAHTHQRSQLYKLIARLIPGSDGLLFMDGATWVRHARALLPVFTRSSVARYAQIIHETTLTHAAQCAWSKLWSLPRLLAGLWQLRRRVTSLQSIVREILEARRSREENGSDWIGQLIAAGFSLPVITDGVNHLYGAFNAVDFSVTCALYELSRQPAWRERLRVELDTRLGQRAFPTLDDLAALPEMSNFRREVFRRYPVAMGIVRRTGAPIEAGSWNIRAGSEVMILLYALHHHPDYWDEPEVFNPDRWRAAPEPKAPGSYAPFLAGPRQCVGRHLAELHFVVVLSALLRHYDIAALDHTMQMTPYLIPRFDRAMPFVARRRLVPGSDDTAGPEHTERGRV